MGCGFQVVTAMKKTRWNGWDSWFGVPGFGVVGWVALMLGVHLEADGLRVVDPRCEHLERPAAVDTPWPRLGWALESETRDHRQSACRILVASSLERLQRDEGDLWDSGKVVSGEQNHIAYLGRRLISNQECFWKVRVWDQHDVPGPWSSAGGWRMGLLRAEDWQARWIRSDHSTGEPLPLFRREIELDRPVRRAVAHVCGLGHHELRVNGRRVGDRFLDPAWSVYERTLQYTTDDITGWLVPGRNAVGVMLGKGFYNTAGDRRVHGVHADRPLMLILQVHLWFEDGTEQVVVSDGSWRTAPGPITHSAILGGEDHDARRWPAGWDRPGFDEGGWAPATETGGPGGVLRAAQAPPMRTLDEFGPVRIDEPEPGMFVFDFGQNASAIPRLRVRGTAGQVVRLTPAEQRHGMAPRTNDGRGRVNPAGVGSPNHWEYTLGRSGSETWSPRFNYSGFQYLEVRGAVPVGRPNPDGLPVIEELVSVHVRADLPMVGRFVCSNPLFNEIDRIVDWAVRGNLAHVLTDCPHREKLGWLEVAYLMGPSIAGRYDLARFYTKVARDIADSQEPDGLVPTVAPAYPRFSGGFAYTPEWGAAAVLVPWLVHQWYGDPAALSAYYGTMKGFVDHLRDTATDLVPRPGLGDWYDYGHGRPVGASQFTPVELTAMATFYRCVRVVAEAAEILGRLPEAAAHRDLADRIRAAFNERFFDGEAEYANRGSPQTANSMALVLGLAPAGREEAVLGRILEDLRARGYQQTAGDVGHWYLLQALARNGQNAAIHAMTERTNLGSYGFIVRSGWTSMPEAWDADTGASMNHCMLGHIQEWFFGEVAGIRPDPETPGFGRFFVAPQPVGDLTWARASHRSVRGLIASSWRIDGERFELEVRVPPNTAATVILPARSLETVTEGGVPVREAAGVKAASGTMDRVTLEVGSGVYRFGSMLPR